MAYNSDFNVIRAQSMADYNTEETTKKRLVFAIIFFCFGMVLLISSIIIKNTATSAITASTAATTYAYTMQASEPVVVSIASPVEKPNPYATKLQSDYNNEKALMDELYLTESRPIYDYYSAKDVRDMWDNLYPNTLQSSLDFDDEHYNLYDVSQYSTLVFFLTYWDGLHDGSTGKVKIYGGNSTDDVNTLLFSEEIAASDREPKQFTIDVSQYAFIKIKIKGVQNIWGDPFITMMGSPMLLK